MATRSSRPLYCPGVVSVARNEPEVIRSLAATTHRAVCAESGSDVKQQAGVGRHRDHRHLRGLCHRFGS